MKQRLISVLAGAVVLLSPLGINIVLPEKSSAQMLPGLEKIQFTEQQKTKLAEIQTQMRSAVDRIVTDEQRNRYKAALEKGSGVQQAIAAMNITPDQQARILKVVADHKTQIEGILTAEQLRQIQENVGK